MRFDKETGEDKAVAAMLRTVPGQILMREIVAEMMRVSPITADAGAVKESEGRRRFCAEFISLLADTNDDRSANPDHAVSVDTAVAVARTVRGRLRPAGGGSGRERRRLARTGGSGEGA